jgi:spermidine synthase
MIIPGEENIIIASSAPLSEKATLKFRFRKFNTKTLFLSEKFIDYSLDAQKTQWLEDEIKKYGADDKIHHLSFRKSLIRNPQPLKKTFINDLVLDSGQWLAGMTESINRDFYPSAMAAALIWWQSIFAPNTAYIYSFIAKFFWFLFLIPLLWFLSGRIGPKGTAFSSGFCSMGLQMVSIWGLQISSGNIYQLIGLLGAVFMAGTALGAAVQQMVSGKWETVNDNIKISSIFPFYLLPANLSPILASEVLFSGWILLWTAILMSSPGSIVTYIILSTGTGFLLGFQYPVIVGLATKKTAAAAGRIYAYDLFGGWLAAILVGTIIIPAGGFLPTMIFLLMIKLASAYWWNRK